MLLYSIAYSANIIEEHGVGNSIQYPNPIVSKGSWYYIARVQQLIKERFFTQGVQTGEEDFPADSVEIIINNIVDDASGDGIFCLP